MKDLKEKLINESNTQKSKFTINDLREALDYYEEYYKEFPEEKGEFPNWGEIDNFFTNEKWCQALMYEENEPLVVIVDKIFDVLYSKYKK